jgi:hypothetical protein
VEAYSAKQLEAEVSHRVLKELQVEDAIAKPKATKVVRGTAHAGGKAVARPSVPKKGVGRGIRHAVKPGQLAFYTKRVNRAVKIAFEESVGEGDIVIVKMPHTAHEQIFRLVVKGLPDIVERRHADQLEKHIESLVDTYLPVDPLAPAYAELINDNAKARANLIEKMPMLTSAAVASLAGHDAQNRSITASRWKKARLIFAVRHNGSDLYPAFQFRDQEPHPTIAKVLLAFPETVSGWKIAFWFAGANGWLAGARPMDQLDAVEQVVAATRHEGEAWMG